MSTLRGYTDHILVAGDEVKSALAIQRLLEAGGYAVTALNSFEQARNLLATSDISLVIIELAASRVTGSLVNSMDGDQGESLRRLRWAQEAVGFCRAIRADKAVIELPILMVSKSQRAQDKVACLDAGATDYLTKPYQRAELASRVAAHLRTRRIDRERTERFEQLNVLHSVSSVLASSLEPDILLSGTLSVLIQNLHADAGIVYLRDVESDQPGIVATEGILNAPEMHHRLLELYSRTAPLMNGKPLVLSPLPETMRSGGVAEVLRGVNGLICAPLGLKGRRIGSICLLSKQPDAFPKPQVDLLSTISTQLSVALDNARLYVETKKSAAQLAFVYNLGNNLMTSLKMEELLGYAVFTVGKSLECDVCAVIVRTASEAEGMASAVFGRSYSDQRPGKNWYNETRVTRYLEAPDGAANLSVETRVSERLLLDPSVLSETIVPLVFDDQLLGMLICGSCTRRPVTIENQRLLGAVAQQLSLAIRNTEMYQSTKDTSINLAVEVSKRTSEIEEQRRFTEKIIDSLPVSLYVVDRDMRIVAWNRNREIGGGGINREQVLGRNLFNVLTRAPRRMIHEEFTEVFRTGEIVKMEQESFLEGQKKVWKISKIPMRVDNAEVTHVITVGEDVTDQKKMNEAVIHAEKLASIGRLAAGVVHEINNPLATIAACAEALTSRVDELSESEVHEDFSEYLLIIRDEAFRCKTITNNLLDFSHQRQAEKVTGDVNHLIEQTLHLIKHHPKLGKMRLLKDLDYTLAPVHANDGQLKQVFIALISNAFDAMESEGMLTIRTRWHISEEGRFVCAEFIDTGCGIPTTHLAKIFDPFFTTKPLGRGTGLGLSVCYGIVSEHGGTIEVDSTEGKGSTFRILLPLLSESHGNATSSSLEKPVLEMESVK